MGLLVMGEGKRMNFTQPSDHPPTYARARGLCFRLCPSLTAVLSGDIHGDGSLGALQLPEQGQVPGVLL